MAACKCPVPVSSVVAGSTTFFPTWSLAAVLATDQHIQDCMQHGRANALHALVEGYTTPAVADVGAASVRLRFMRMQAPCTDAEASCTDANIALDMNNLKEGGYLFGIRSRIHGGRFMPAVAGVPGKQGLDRYGNSRLGLAECVVMGRPVTDGSVTVLPDLVLQEWLPTGNDMEVIILQRLTDFFLGLNAGTWLKIRISELVAKGESWVCEHCKPFFIAETETTIPQQLTMLLENTGLAANGEIGPGIADSSEAFQYWGGSGNAGVSGQVILLAEGTKFTADTLDDCG